MTNTDVYYEGSVDFHFILHYDSEPDDDLEFGNDEEEGDVNNATIENDNDSNVRGVTNIDDLGNI